MISKYLQMATCLLAACVIHADTSTLASTKATGSLWYTTQPILIGAVDKQFSIEPSGVISHNATRMRIVSMTVDGIVIECEKDGWVPRLDSTSIELVQAWRETWFIKDGKLTLKGIVDGKVVPAQMTPTHVEWPQP